MVGSEEGEGGSESGGPLLWAVALCCGLSMAIPPFVTELRGVRFECWSAGLQPRLLTACSWRARLFDRLTSVRSSFTRYQIELRVLDLALKVAFAKSVGLNHKVLPRTGSVNVSIQRGLGLVGRWAFVTLVC